MSGAGQRTGRLTGKIAVITGAARGIGRATAVAFAREGADVVGIDLAHHASPTTDFEQPTPDDLTRIGELVHGAGGRWLPIILDQRDLGALRQAAAQVEREFGGLDIVFANASIQPFKPILKMEDADWYDQIDINLTGNANVIRVRTTAGSTRQRPRHVLDPGPPRDQARRRLLGVQVRPHRPRQVGGARVRRASDHRERGDPWPDRHAAHAPRVARRPVDRRVGPAADRRRTEGRADGRRGAAEADVVRRPVDRARGRRTGGRLPCVRRGTDGERRDL